MRLYVFFMYFVFMLFAWKEILILCTLLTLTYHFIQWSMSDSSKKPKQKREPVKQPEETS